MAPDARSSDRRGTARVAILDAATALIRRQGLSATSVDAICAEAAVTKGAFFHHFASKDDLAVAVAAHWSQTTGELFGTAAYHDGATAADRVFGYIDLRESLVGTVAAEYACLVGTMVQEAFQTSPEIRDACGQSILGHAATLEADLSDALQAAGVHDVDPASLARFTQSVLQGAFIIGKAGDDPTFVLEGIAHLRRYLRHLLTPAQVPQ